MGEKDRGATDRSGLRQYPAPGNCPPQRRVDRSRCIGPSHRDRGSSEQHRLIFVHYFLDVLCRPPPPSPPSPFRGGRGDHGRHSSLLGPIAATVAAVLALHRRGVDKRVRLGKERVSHLSRRSWAWRAFSPQPQVQSICPQNPFCIFVQRSLSAVRGNLSTGYCIERLLRLPSPPPSPSAGPLLWRRRRDPRPTPLLCARSTQRASLPRPGFSTLPPS